MSKQLRVAISLVLLCMVIIVLVSAPEAFLPQGVKLIDTEIRGTSGNERFVRTKMDFGSAQQMGNILLGETEWSASLYDMSSVQEQLGADILTTWVCYHPSSSTPIWFLVIQSRDVISFHPPPVCYQAMGYRVTEESTIEITVSGEGWAQQQWLEALEDPDVYEGTISVKKLVVTREKDNRPVERRLVLYYYIKDDSSSSPNTITMIRVSAVVPLYGSYDEVMALEEQIISDFFPLMFEPRSAEASYGGWLIDHLGAFGWLAIIVAIMGPMGFLMYPMMKPRVMKVIHRNQAR